VPYISCVALGCKISFLKNKNKKALFFQQLHQGCDQQNTIPG